MPYWFTTFTFADQVPENCLKTTLDSISSKWLYVVEYGKNDNNEHYHTLYQSEKYSKTSRYNEYFKSVLYDAEFVKNLPRPDKLIKTKKALNWTKLYSDYLIKEQSNKSFENLRNNGFCEKTLKKLFKKSGIESLLKGRVFLSFLQAPFVLYKNMIENGYPYDLVNDGDVIKYLRRLQRDGYITHHLIDEKKITQIEWSINGLLKDGYKNFSQYNI